MHLAHVRQFGQPKHIQVRTCSVNVSSNGQRGILRCPTNTNIKATHAVGSLNVKQGPRHRIEIGVVFTFTKSRVTQDFYNPN